MYKPGQIIKGILKNSYDDEELSRVSCLIVELRSNQYNLINTENCISVLFWNEQIIGMQNLQDFINDNIEVETIVSFEHS